MKHRTLTRENGVCVLCEIKIKDLADLFLISCWQEKKSGFCSDTLFHHVSLSFSKLISFTIFLPIKQNDNC